MCVCVFCAVLISPLHSATPLQAIKQTLSEVFAVYLSFATELEEQSKQLLEKLEQARGSLRGGDAESESELGGSPGTLSMWLSAVSRNKFKIQKNLKCGRYLKRVCSALDNQVS